MISLSWNCKQRSSELTRSQL